MKPSKQSGIRKLRWLVLLWVLASLAALAMPIFDLAYLHPSLVKLMSMNTERDAQRMAENALNRISPDDLVIDQSSTELKGQLNNVRTELGLLRLTVMGLDGEFQQSAAIGFGQRLGLVHLRQVLTSGRGMSRGTKGTLRLPNGQEQITDLMILTTPIRRDGLMLGALEVVYDWSLQRQALETLIGRATLVMLMIPIIFLLVVGMVASHALKAVRDQEKIQDELAENKDKIEAKHRELAQLFRQIEVAKEEWQVAMDCIEDMVLLVDKDGLIRRCNEAFRRLIGTAYPAILGKNWRQILFTPEVEVVSMTQARFQLYHKDSRQWLDLNFYPYTDHGDGLQWTVITIAVTSAQDGDEPTHLTAVQG